MLDIIPSHPIMSALACHLSMGFVIPCTSLTVFWETCMSWFLLIACLCWCCQSFSEHLPNIASSKQSLHPVLGFVGRLLTCEGSLLDHCFVKVLQTASECLLQISAVPKLYDLLPVNILYSSGLLFIRTTNLMDQACSVIVSNHLQIRRCPILHCRVFLHDAKQCQAYWSMSRKLSANWAELMTRSINIIALLWSHLRVLKTIDAAILHVQDLFGACSYFESWFSCWMVLAILSCSSWLTTSEEGGCCRHSSRTLAFIASKLSHCTYVKILSLHYVQLLTLWGSWTLFLCYHKADIGWHFPWITPKKGRGQILINQNADLHRSVVIDCLKEIFWSSY